MNKFIRNLRCNGDCELVYLRPFYNLDRDNIHYVCDYDEDKIGVNVFALYEENQELKKHLKVPKACNLKTLEDYKSYYEDTTREQILEDTYIDYCAYANLAHRYSKLKKQLEDITLCRDIASGHRKEVQDRETILLNQQQEFLKYLEDEINACKVVSDLLFNSNKEIKVYKEILQKYKEIIGVQK